MTKSRGIYFRKGSQEGTVCSVEGCGHETVCKNLCNAHYLRNKKGSTLSTAVQKREEASRRCIAEGCTASVSQKGGKDLCPKHYKRQLCRTRKEILVALAGGKCLRCGLQHPPVVYDFHHRNPEEKVFSIGEQLINKSMDALIEEARKCDLLCANCHRIITHGGF